MATLADLQALQQRQQLAQIMAMQRPMGNNQGARAASGIGALVNALAAKNLGGKAQAMQNEINSADLAALAKATQGADPVSRAEILGQIQQPEMRQLALALTAPVSPVSVPRGGTLVNPMTGAVVAQGAPAAMNVTPTGVPGVMLDRDSGELVDVLAGGQSQGGSAPVNMSDYRETPQQKRERETTEASERERQKQEVNLQADLEAAKVANEQGATNFLKQLKQARDIVAEAEKAGVDADSLFGPLQSGDGIMGSVVRGTSQLVGTDAEKYRKRLERVFAGMELDVAKMKLKGQGSVTESERAIAKQTIPGLNLPDWAAAEAIFSDIEGEANGILGLTKDQGDDQIVISNHPQYGDITEADIQETMRQNNITREQVLQKLGVGGAP